MRVGMPHMGNLWIAMKATGTEMKWKSEIKNENQRQS